MENIIKKKLKEVEESRLARLAAKRKLVQLRIKLSVRKLNLPAHYKRA